MFSINENESHNRIIEDISSSASTLPSAHNGEMVAPKSGDDCLGDAVLVAPSAVGAVSKISPGVSMSNVVFSSIPVTTTSINMEASPLITSTDNAATGGMSHAAAVSVRAPPTDPIPPSTTLLPTTPTGASNNPLATATATATSSTCASTNKSHSNSNEHQNTNTQNIMQNAPSSQVKHEEAVATKTTEVDKYTVQINVTAPPLFQSTAEKIRKKNARRSLKAKNNTNASTIEKNRLKPTFLVSPSSLSGPSHLLASVVPSAFPKHLSYRALAAYSTIRTLSVPLRLSPFTPNSFLRALSLPIHSKLIGDMHVSILRMLFAYYDLGVYHHRGDGLSKMKLPPKKPGDGIAEYLARKDTLYPKAGENLLYLDHFTWPLYLCDYVDIVEDEPPGEVESPLLDGEDMEGFFESKPTSFLSKLNSSQTTVGVEQKMQHTFSNTNGCFSPNKLITTHHQSQSQSQPPFVVTTPIGAGQQYQYPTMQPQYNHTSSPYAYGHMPMNSSIVDQRLESTSIPPLDTGVDPYLSKKRKLDSTYYDRNDPSSNGFISKLGGDGDMSHYDASMERSRKQARINDTIGNFLMGEVIELNALDSSSSEGLKVPNNAVDNSNNDKQDKEKDEKEDVQVEVEELDENISYSSSKSHVLKILNMGIPHFRLSAGKKLDILEYMIDELIDTDLIKDELEMRHIENSQKTTLYGKLPNVEQLNNLVNEDECFVCGTEGDLICCDGCVASYHRECINIPLSRVMSDEKWFCHECKIKDSSRFGPLEGRRKCNLDWFTLKDMDLTNDAPSSVESQYYMLNTSTIDQNTSFCLNLLKDVEFLIIHGYVFARNVQTKEGVNITSILSPNSAVNSNDTKEKDHCKNKNLMVPLNPSELYSLLLVLGPSLCYQWPWAQIPFNPEELGQKWKNIGIENDTVGPDNVSLIQASKQRYLDFMYRADAFNPILYTNLYQKAPFHKLLRQKIGRKKIKLHPKVLNMENMHFKNDLSRDTSNDINLVQLLKGGLYDPLDPVRDYMISLEKQLLKSTLLHELWGLRSKSGDLNWWNKRVMKSKSMKALGKLFVRLIDDTYSRAFYDEWNFLPGVTNDDLYLHNNESRNYTDLPENWTPKEEKLRRKWDCSSECDMLKLLGQVSKYGRKGQRMTSLTSEKDGLEPDVQKKIVDTNTSTITEKKEDDVQSGVSGDNSRKARRRTQEEAKGRRKSDRHHGITNPLTCTSEQIKRNKLNVLESACNEDEDKEGDWPLAGRKLFIPSGSLTQSTAKWLGRNSGNRRIPHITYPKKFEIGLPSVSQIWRQNTLSATSFEQLVYQIRFIDSYLNRNVMTSLDSLTRRVGQLKGTIQKVVKCSQIDVSSGTLEYFVVNRSKQRGCWLSSDTVDASTFVIHRSQKIQLLRENRLEEWTAKEECKRKEEALAKEATAKAAAKLVIELARKKAESRKKVDSHIKSVLKLHEIHVKKLMKECKEMGLSVVPTNVIKPWRDKHFNDMQKVINEEKCTRYDNKQLSSKLSQAEVDGTKAYVNEIQRKIKMRQEAKNAKNTKNSNVASKPKASSPKKIIPTEAQGFHSQEILLQKQKELERRQLQHRVQEMAASQNVIHTLQSPSQSDQRSDLLSRTNQITDMLSRANQRPGMNSMANQRPDMLPMSSQRPDMNSRSNQRPDMSSMAKQIADMSSRTNQRPDMLPMSSQRPGVNSMANQIADMSSRSSQRPNMSSRTIQRPDMNSMANQRPDMSSISNQRPAMNSMASQISNMSSRTNQRPAMNSMASQRSDMSSRTNQRPAMNSMASQRPDMSSISNQRPAMNSMANQRSDMISRTNQRPDMNSMANQRPVMNSMANQRPDMVPRSNQRPDMSSMSNQRPDMSSMSNQRPDMNSMANQRPDMNSVTNQRPDMVPRSNQRPDINSVTNQRPDISSRIFTHSGLDTFDSIHTVPTSISSTPNQLTQVTQGGTIQHEPGHHRNGNIAYTGTLNSQNIYPQYGLNSVNAQIPNSVTANVMNGMPHHNNIASPFPMNGGINTYPGQANNYSGQAIPNNNNIHSQRYGSGQGYAPSPMPVSNNMNNNHRIALQNNRMPYTAVPQNPASSQPHFDPTASQPQYNNYYNFGK